MAIIGYYEYDHVRVPRPRVRGYVSFTGLGVQGPVDFLVDSGADSVILHVNDARNLGISQLMLRHHTARESVGVGGLQRYFSEQGSISFEDGQGSYIRCYLDIGIAGPESSTTPETVPSLLGRDFLNLCDVRLNYSRDLVALDPLNVDSGFIQPSHQPA